MPDSKGLDITYYNSVDPSMFLLPLPLSPLIIIIHMKKIRDTWPIFLIIGVVETEFVLFFWYWVNIQLISAFGLLSTLKTLGITISILYEDIQSFAQKDNKWQFLGLWLQSYTASY